MLLQYILRRIVIMVPTILIISALVFAIIELPPGDYLESYIAELQTQGEKVDQKHIEFLRQEYGFDKPLIERYFLWVWGMLQGDFGYSFEYHWIRPYYGEALGDDLAAYKPLFEPQNHTREADATLYGPIRSLVTEVNAEVDSVWRERVATWLDLEQFVTQTAIETFLSELDGLLGYEGMNNFYLYRNAGASTHRVVPWDRDNAFQRIDSPIFLRTDENIILRKALAFDDLRTLYLDVLEASARAALEDGWLAGQIERLLPTIEAAALEDPKKPFSDELFAEQVEFLRAFARERPAFVLREVSQAR